ncbi:dUTP diphosphatase [Corynebacterium urealyticum]|uniref:dUTP diphosphatase n=1 Tax=Corynebacterium urealyticum TaxID=43771 RepID=UPI00293EDF09|nr:dUTP diphosphatase [Corynebacterium urealyticum]WOH94950.1 dUTP diphosphatase [Corynebacterium urealyticum]
MKILFTLDDGATAPTRAHSTDAGLDLYSLQSATIPPGGRELVSTGVHVSIPPGYVGLICPRSGLAHKQGLTVLNAPGIIDAGYTGGIKVNLHNADYLPQHVDTGDRIAQLVITPIADAHLVQVGTQEATERGDNGHGSTGR